MQKIKHLSLIIIPLAICASGLLRAEGTEEKRVLTLAEAVALATERHPQILSARARIEAL